jgi:hypothetical protein
MAQATLEFSPATAADLAAAPAAAGRTQPAPMAAAVAPGLVDRSGYAIGWDHAHHRVTPPLCHLDEHSPVRQGWAAGRAAFGARTLRPTAAARQWLALRLQAWQHGQAFEDVQVNPAFLARIDTERCPVRRVPLLLCSGTADDATVVRLNTQAAYAAGNLAVVSAPVAAALVSSDWSRALAMAERLAEGDRGADGRPASTGAAGQADGLDAAAWTRAAVLASFTTPLPHARAAMLPLRVLPPNRVRVINPVQALQVVLTQQFSAAGYARRLLGLAALMPSTETRQAFQIFMHTVLARRLGVGPTPTAQALREALEDTWSDPLVNRRWQRLALRLNAADCEQLLQRAARRQLVVGASRWLSAETATEGWALDAGTTRLPGRAAPGSAAVAALALAPVPVPAQANEIGATSAAARPGSTRSRGSQKLAS